MSKRRYFHLLVLAFAVALSGCGGAETASTGGTDSNPSPADSAKYLLATEPADAQAVRAVRTSARDGDRVAVVGRIGGEEDPWVEGIAAFNLVDEALRPCNEISGDRCATPWDYCCQPDLAEGRVLVQVVDGEGKTVRSDARNLLGVKELQTVVVQGIAKKDEAGNLTLMADSVFVRP
jgi:hypothetical protein